MSFNGYKDLEVWKRGIEIADEIYGITINFPRNEIYGLSSQMQRAGVSIPSNIAEGYRRNQPGDFSRFLRIALGSCAEIETQLIIAFRRKYITNENYEKVSNSLEEESRMLVKLIESVNQRSNK